MAKLSSFGLEDDYIFFFLDGKGKKKGANAHFVFTYVCSWHMADF